MLLNHVKLLLNKYVNITIVVFGVLTFYWSL